MRRNALCFLFVFAMILGCNKVSGDVDIVKNGILEFDKSLTIGQAFSNYKYFKEVKWEAIKTDNGRRIVTARAMVDLTKHPRFNEDVPLRLKQFALQFQFIINQDKTIQVAWCGAEAEKANGEKIEPQQNVVIAKCINELREIYNNSPGYSEEEAKNDRNERARAELKNSYTAAQAFFSDKLNGVVTLEKLYKYGLTPSSSIKIIIVDGTVSNLRITAKHEKSDITYVINAAGNINFE